MFCFVGDRRCDVKREEFNKEMEETSLRQQRKNWLSFKSEKVQKELEHYEVPFKDYVTIKQAFDMINEIHDDFESRTCENCKHFYDVKKHKHYGYCARKGIPIEVEHNWFCAGFEPKEQK